MNTNPTGKPRRNVHELKCWPQSFRAILTGRKRFEVRRDDRRPRFESGDQVTLHEYDPGDGTRPPKGFTGQKATYLIGYVSRSAALPAGWCAFELISPEDAARVGLAILGPEGAADSERRPDGPGLGLRR